VTTSDPAQGRPVPDTDDLRLLAEIINNGSIGLPQAAWNARMSQSDAAARLVTMAERGMPLRLVAEGDQQLLWRIAQAGPATAGVPAVLPPASAVPPHEQAMAGAVPLGQPPFGAESSEPDDPTRRALISGEWMQQVTGPGGEQLDVTLQQIIDPADSILAPTGRLLEPGLRALLVLITVGNRGTIDFRGVPDRFLVIKDSAGTVLPKDNTPVEGYPANYSGVPAATLVPGWSLFVLPAATEVAEVQWSVQPDVPGATVSWRFGPA
jgi:hypothetical protein